ncbi:hypothetical protein LENED_002344 [Lentinula edodes]|uniref:Uncharacterized protein n=1 Tax=Lentinula edodes TaxID=5353 RepID=A0A1Q3E0Z9_LENED|nr:hypothetical protein LENED_002344 [Lentinula edodes]
MWTSFCLLKQFVIVYFLPPSPSSSTPKFPVPRQQLYCSGTRNQYQRVTGIKIRLAHGLSFLSGAKLFVTIRLSTDTQCSLLPLTLPLSSHECKLILSMTFTFVILFDSAEY